MNLAITVSEARNVRELHGQIKKFQHQLEIQTKRVENLKKSNEFYADQNNSPEGRFTRDAEIVVRQTERELVRYGEHPLRKENVVVGGKLARSCQAIDQELEKQLEEVK